MNKDQIAALKYGNVISNGAGDKFLVLHVVRTAEGHVEHVGLIPAVNADELANYNLVSHRSSETFLGGRSVG